jgi:peptidoglycan-associated lipoprotein
MRNKPILLFSFVIIVSAILSSCSPKTKAEADLAWDKREYSGAGKIYKEIMNKPEYKEDRAAMAFRAAECYRLVNDYKNAARMYERAEKYKYGPEAVKMRADMLKRQEEYTEAIILFNKYLEEAPNDAEAKKLLEGATLALQWKQSQECILFKVENLKKLNGRSDDNCAVQIKKESIIFTSDREDGVNKNLYPWTGAGFYDMWVAPLKKTRGELTVQSPELLKGTANRKYNEGSATFNSKGSTMFFTVCGGDDGKLTTCQIYSSNRRGRDEWDDPIKLDFCDTAYTYGHPSLSNDGKTLYFSADIPGGYGGKDIWMVKEVGRGKTWSDPINLGPEINTDADEMFPSIADDGTLYFSSNGHVGMGGLDMFKSTGTGNEWSTPENLKYPLNSGADDFSLVYKPDDNTSGYLSSNRTGGRGGDDIYEFFPIPQNFKITGVVKDCETGKPIEQAGIFISNDKDSNKVVLRTDKNGFYSMDLAKEVSYELYADKNEAYYIGSKTAYQTTKKLICSKELVQNFEMCRLCLDCMFNVSGILYDLDKANIRKDAAKILDDSVVSLLKRFPSVTLELGSHTDCRASAEYNRDLAQRRADSAVAYIVSKGIDSARLVAKGYGEDMLAIEKCKCDQSDYQHLCTEAEHQQNRRTTIKILRTDYISPAEAKRRATQDSLNNLNKAPTQQQAQPKDKNDREKERLRKKEEQEKKKKQKAEERQRKLDEKKKLMDEKKKKMEEDRKKRQKGNK